MSRNRTSKDAFSQVTTSPSPGGSAAGGCIPDSVASAGARFVSGLVAWIAKSWPDRPWLGGPGYRPGTHTGATARPERDREISANPPMAGRDTTGERRSPRRRRRGHD